MSRRKVSSDWILVDVAQVRDDVRLFDGEEGRQDAIGVQWEASLQIDCLDPVSGEIVDHIDV